MMKNEPFFAQFDANQERDFFWTIIPFGKSTQHVSDLRLRGLASLMQNLSHSEV
jgi:hypothetical protein